MRIKYRCVFRKFNETDFNDIFQKLTNLYKSKKKNHYLSL